MVIAGLYSEQCPPRKGSTRRRIFNTSFCTGNLWEESPVRKIRPAFEYIPFETTKKAGKKEPPGSNPCHDMPESQEDLATRFLQCSTEWIRPSCMREDIPLDPAASTLTPHLPWW
jgi:hypothetical protein